MTNEFLNRQIQNDNDSDLISNLVFLLITKHIPNYWDEPPFQKQYNFELFSRNVSEELQSVEFLEVDADAISNNLSLAVQNHLCLFPDPVISPSELSANPKNTGLRKEDLEKITDFSMKFLLDNGYQTSLMQKYKDKILSLLDKLNQDIRARQYPGFL